MITIEDILNVCDGTLLCGDKENVCKNFSNDTRTIKDGDVYIGIKGEKFNGNKFYLDAFNNGASVCILDKDTYIVEKKKTIILVDDTLEALKKLASYKRSLYNIPVVAVTGSVGKTSTRDIINKVLSSKYNTLCTTGNHNNHIGLPLTILKLDRHDCLVVEMGMNHLNEIHELSLIAKPTISVITNVGTAHIGNLGSRENILKAKMEIVDGMDYGTLIINNDNDLLRTVDYKNLVTVGIKYKSDFQAKNIIDNGFDSSFDVNNNHIELPIGSEAFIYNALMAYAVGKQLDIEDELIINSLKEFMLTPHRLEIIKLKNLTLIDDTYNASLDSVRNDMSLLSKVKTRKIFIFADILEVKNFEREIHEEVADTCNGVIDILITIGECSEYTYQRAKSLNMNTYHYNNNQECINDLDNIIQKDDTILLKGSNGMKLIEIVTYLKDKYQNKNKN